MRYLIVAVMLAVASLLAGCITPPPGEPGPPPEPPILDGRDQLYLDPDNAALRWVRAHPAEPKAQTIERAIAYRPSARWFTAAEPDLTAHVRAYVTAAESARMMPLLAASFTGNERCADAQAPGLVDAFVRGIGEQKAIVVLEPGLLGSRCGADRAVTGYLDTAVGALRGGAPNALILIDATADSMGPAALARRLAAAGLARADGFTLNVGGYVPAVDLAGMEAGMAMRIRAAAEPLTGRSDYVVLADSSRNGAPVESSCNPAGARLGPNAMFANQPGGFQETWITLPGTSDGPCGAAPDSRKGDFVPALAVQLAGE